MRPGKDHLRSLGGHAHLGDIGTDPVALAIVFPRHLFPARQEGLGAAEVDDQAPFS